MSQAYPALLRVATAACLVITGWIHTDLYFGGYRVIPTVGRAFLLQASASYAVAAVLLAGAPALYHLAAAAVAASSLAGFALSRTTGIAGFVEHGWQPAPQALLSLLTEIAILLLTAAAINHALRHRQPGQRFSPGPSWRRWTRRIAR